MTTANTDPDATALVRPTVKWTDGMRSDLLKLYSHFLQEVGEETFWECFDVVSEEFHFFVENRQVSS